MSEEMRRDDPLLPEESAPGEPLSQEGEPKKEEKESSSDDLFYWLNALTTALVCLVLVFTFFGRLTRVDGHSMDPTLQDNELLLVWSLGYSPKQGDIVVLNKTTAETLNGVAIVKRVIATGGQTVDIDYGTSTVYVDGVALDEPYIREPMGVPYTPSAYDSTGVQTHWEVPEGSIFVMGDNRNKSTDSRDARLGAIDEDYVLGKVVCGLWPPSKIGPL